MASINLNECINVIKQCLNPTKSNDYSFVSYEQRQNTPEKQRNFQSTDYPTKPSRLNIHFNEIEPAHELKKQYANANLINGNLLFSKPKFHSTQIEPADSSIYLSVLTHDNYNYKKSSTMINSNENPSIISDDLSATQINSNYHNITDDLSTECKMKLNTNESSSLYFSPIRTNKPAAINTSNDSTLTTSSYYTDDETTFNSTQSNSFTSQDFQTVRSSIFEQSIHLNNQSEHEQLYVCIVPYEAKIQGDLNLKYAERVKIVHGNKDYSLVQNITTKQCGYIPTNCIISLSSFLNQL